MKAMCPAEEHQVPVPPSEAGNGQLASDGASGTVEWAYLSDPGAGRENNEDFAGAWAPDGDDQAPLFSNVFVLVTFHKTVTLGGGGAAD